MKLHGFDGLALYTAVRVLSAVRGLSWAGVAKEVSDPHEDQIRPTSWADSRVPVRLDTNPETAASNL